MTTEEKVAQLFITRPEEITGVSQFTQAGNKTKAAIGTYPIGGFVFRQENFSGEAAVTKMMSSLQSFSQERLGVNLFLAIDEEGEKDFLLLQLMDMRHSRHHHSLEMLTQRAAVQER